MSEAHIRANEVLRRFESDKSISGAEIGVAIGQMSENLLKNPKLKLLMIDSWEEKDKQPEHYRNSGDWHATCTYDEQTAHMNTAIKVTEFAGDRRQVIRKPSVEAAKDVKDGSLDFVFIDADHSYEGCRADIEAWKEKVRKGGYLCGHDYGHTSDAPWAVGPKRAVDEAVKKYKWNLETGPNYTWFVRM